MSASGRDGKEGRGGNQGGKSRRRGEWSVDNCVDWCLERGRAGGVKGAFERDSLLGCPFCGL